MVVENKNDTSFSPSLNKEALEDVIDALEENKDALDNEFEANQIGERINEWVTTASQTDELTASRFGASIDTENVMPESGEGSSRIEGGTMFRQAAVAQDADQSMNGFEGGSASGDADADALEGKIISRAYTKVKEKNFTISNFSDILIFQTNGFTSQPLRGFSMMKISKLLILIVKAKIPLDCMRIK